MSMLRELEKLLREVAEQQGGPKAKPQPGAGTARPAPTAPPVEAEILDEDELEVIADPRQSVASRRLDTTDVTERASQLGHRLGQTDERLEARLHKKFDHDLTRLDDRPMVGAQSPGGEKSPFVAGVVKMLREPESIRNAVILNEILSRPEGRW